MRPVGRILLIVFLVFSASCVSMPPTANLVAPSNLRGNLTRFLNSDLIHKSDIYNGIVQTLQKLEQAPSCFYRSTFDLLETCKSLDIKKSVNLNQAVEDEQDKFAVRYALCEIWRGFSTIPKQCQSLIAQKESKKHAKCNGDKAGFPHCDEHMDIFDSIVFERASKQHLKNCVVQLGTQAQWWTSYSNSRRDALFLCQAVRAEADRDHILMLHKNLTSVTHGVTRILAETADSLATHLNIHSSVFESFRLLSQQILRDLETIPSKIDDLFRHFSSNLGRAEETVLSSFKNIKKAVNTMASDVEHLDSKIKISATSVDNLTKSFNSSLTLSAQTAQNLSLTHQQSLSRSLESTHEILSALAGMKTYYIESLRASLSSLSNQHTSLDADITKTRTKISDMNQTISHLSPKLDNFTHQLSIAEGLIERLNERLDSVGTGIWTTPFTKIMRSATDGAVWCILLGFLWYVGMKHVAFAVMATWIVVYFITAIELRRTLWSAEHAQESNASMTVSAGTAIDPA